MTEEKRYWLDGDEVKKAVEEELEKRWNADMLSFLERIMLDESEKTEHRLKACDLILRKGFQITIVDKEKVWP